MSRDNVIPIVPAGSGRRTASGATRRIAATGSFLSRLAPAEQAALHRLGRVEEIPAGQPFLCQGDRDRKLYLLLAGAAEVRVTGADGSVEPIAVRTPGDLVGELSYLDGRPRSATVVAVRDCAVRVISRPAFTRYLAEHPGAQRSLLLLLAHRLRTATLPRTPAAA
jgi:CRP/FNR family cyclic AMP-dependent transcriptional regulator